MPTGRTSSESGKGSGLNMEKLTVGNPMSAGVHSLWKQDQLLDYTIQVGNREFRVHKVIMASMSEYFRAMLTAGMVESGKDTVKIEDVDADIVETLVRYIYTNKMDITIDTAAEILHGALYLQMQPAIELSIRFIIDNVDSRNWLDVLTLFRSYGLMDAVRQVKGYVKRNIMDIVKAACVLDLPKDEFYFVVENWQSSEFELFKLVLKWVDTNEAERNEYIDDLLYLVRYSLMTPKQLSQVKEAKELYTTAKRWHDLIDKACEYHKLPTHQRVLDTSEQTKVRSAPGFVSFSAEKTVAGYFHEPLQEQKFLQHKALVMGDNMDTVYGQIEVNNFLVVNARSEEGEKWQIFNPRTLQWGDMATLERLTSYAAFTHNMKQLFVVGGIGDFGGDFTDTIDTYIFKDNEWSTFSMLPVQTKYCGACIIGNGLYVSGGLPEHAANNNQAALLSRMDRLDLSSRTWETKAQLLSPRSGHTMHVMTILGEDVICVVDNSINVNFSDMDSTLVLEYYKPEKNCWLRCPFTFKQPLDVRRCDLWRTANNWVRGNTIFIVNTEFIMDEENVSAVLTLPEEGTMASVDYVLEIEERLDMIENVLQIIPTQHDIQSVPDN